MAKELLSSRLEMSLLSRRGHGAGPGTLCPAPGPQDSLALRESSFVSASSSPGEAALPLPGAKQQQLLQGLVGQGPISGSGGAGSFSSERLSFSKATGSGPGQHRSPLPTIHPKPSGGQGEGMLPQPHCWRATAGQAAAVTVGGPHGR